MMKSGEEIQTKSKCKINSVLEGKAEVRNSRGVDQIIKDVGNTVP